MRTFSSIYAFNASRFGARRATCITNGAEGGGGGVNKPNDDASWNEKACWSLSQKLQGKRNGVATKDLAAAVRKDYPGEFNDSEGYRRIMGALQYMKNRQGNAERIGAGLWRLRDADNNGSSSKPTVQNKKTQNEKAKSKLVAELLCSDGICASVRIIEDDHRRGKWSNPDVVGAVMPSKLAMCNGFLPKLMAVEVKDATSADVLFGGFAQACSYQGFAHMACLVVPWCDNNDIARVLRLCRTNGVGLAFIRDDEKDEGEWLDWQIPAREQEPNSVQFGNFLDHLGITRIEQLRPMESSSRKNADKKSAKRGKKRHTKKGNRRPKKKG